MSDNSEPVQPEQGEQPPTFESWLGQQGDDVKGLVSSHIGGLTSALDSERNQRKDLEKALKAATSQAKTGEEALAQLQELQAKYEESARKNAFVTSAIKSGVNSPDLAWLAAKQLDAFKRNGEPDWEHLKEHYPALFASPQGRAPSVNAGAGSGRNQVPTTMTKDERLRRALKGK